MLSLFRNVGLILSLPPAILSNLANSQPPPVRRHPLSAIRRYPPIPSIKPTPQLISPSSCPADGYTIHPDKIAEEISRGVSVILTSNPRNPTGQVVANPELSEIQDICRDRATLIMDEFYGGYNYTSSCDGSVVSAADNIDDVNADDVLIIDGLTKRFRLPGWRVAWVVGPKEFIKAIGSCGSYLDGGTNVPFQEAAVGMLEPGKVRAEMKALQRHFVGKRDLVVGRLREMGFEVKQVPNSTFYIWLDLSMFFFSLFLGPLHPFFFSFRKWICLAGVRYGELGANSVQVVCRRRSMTG